jgi:hypothetical protein
LYVDTIDVHDTGTNDTFVGDTAGNLGSTTSVESVGVGYEALKSLTSGQHNTAVGSKAMRDNQGGYYNTAVGKGALLSITNAYNNTAVGHSALATNISGYDNTAVGYKALFQTTGTDNTAVGYQAGYTLASGDDGAVMIGNEAGYYETASNKLYIDNAPRANEADGRVKSLLYGLFDADVANQYLTINAGIITLGSTDYEDLTIDTHTTADTIAFGTNTGVTTLDWGTLDLLTAGNLTLTGTASELIVDTDTLVVNASGYADKIGIGTATPASTAKVHLYGTTTNDYLQIDTGIDLSFVAPPDADNIAVALAAGGSVDVGLHYYYVSFYTNEGETSFDTSPERSITTAGANKTVNVTIPTSSDYRVVGRKIYRTKAGASKWKTYLVDTQPDNTETTYADTKSDASLTGNESRAYYQPNTTNAVFLKDGVVACIISDNATMLGTSANPGGHGISIGYKAGAAQTSGNQNICIGQNSGLSLTTGTSNTLIGASSGRTLTTANQNVALGRNTGRGTTGSTGTFIGYYTGYHPTGAQNTFVGGSAGYGVSGSASDSCVTVGWRAGYALDDGDDNVLLGHSAGLAVSSGNENIMIGYKAGDATTTGGGNIVIGANIDTSAAGASDELNIGGLIKGIMTGGSEYVLIPAPVYFTQTDGNEKIDSDADGDLDIYGTDAIDLHTAIVNFGYAGDTDSSGGAATHINASTNMTDATQDGWLKIEINGTSAWIPYWL